MDPLKDNHTLFTSQQDVSDICKPLFNYLRISYFHFRRTFKDGSYFVLASNSSWPLYFIEKDIPVQTPAPKSNFNSKSFFSLWKGNVPEQTVSDAKNFHNINNAVALIERGNEYFDSYSFASNKEDTYAAEMYINNVDAFLKFAPYFKEKATPIINEAEKQRIILPAHLQDLSLVQLVDLENKAYKKEIFFKEIMPAKFCFILKVGKATLTKRENECLQHLAHGKNKKEIGSVIGLSPRTVETHLEKVRKKFSCYTNAESINIWWANHKL